MNPERSPEPYQLPESRFKYQACRKGYRPRIPPPPLHISDIPGQELYSDKAQLSRLRRSLFDLANEATCTEPASRETSNPDFPSSSILESINKAHGR